MVIFMTVTECFWLTMSWLILLPFRITEITTKSLEGNGDSVINDFGIILDANGEYSFVAESDTQRLRFIADIYGKKTIDELSDKQKDQSAADIMHYLCSDKTYGYGINEKKLDKSMILKLVNIRYAMSLNSYQKYISTTLHRQQLLCKCDRIHWSDFHR